MLGGHSLCWLLDFSVNLKFSINKVLIKVRERRERLRSMGANEVYKAQCLLLHIWEPKWDSERDVRHPAPLGSSPG